MKNGLLTMILISAMKKFPMPMKQGFEYMATVLVAIPGRITFLNSSGDEKHLLFLNIIPAKSRTTFE